MSGDGGHDSRPDFDWLPARIHPVRGESFDSYCGRLAHANGLTRGALEHTCLIRYPSAGGAKAAIACAIDVDAAILESCALPHVRYVYGYDDWRLATTEWLLPSL
jgi:hypothetical protein